MKMANSHVRILKGSQEWGRQMALADLMWVDELAEDGGVNGLGGNVCGWFTSVGYVRICPNNTHGGFLWLATATNRDILSAQEFLREMTLAMRSAI